MKPRSETCSVCGQPRYKKSRSRSVCIKHWRFYQMREGAQRRGLPIPTFEELEAMTLATNGLICQDCGCQMVWVSSEGERKRVASLQHYRERPMAIVCMTCNSRHGAASMVGDEWLNIPKDHKKCPSCSRVLALASFRKSSQQRWMSRRGMCRSCENEQNRQWVKNNPERYSEIRRRLREKRKFKNHAAETV